MLVRILLILLILPTTLLADVTIDESFYTGVDPLRNDETIGRIDNSLEEEFAQDKYYGYKISSDGFFISPEVFVTEGSADARLKDVETLDYDVKANIGYDFNRHFSAFVTYDLLEFAYNPNQNSAQVEHNNEIGSQIGFGSQFNVSHDFGIKFSYSQRFEESPTSSSAQIKTEMFSVGTVYSF